MSNGQCVNESEHIVVEVKLTKKQEKFLNEYILRMRYNEDEGFEIDYKADIILNKENEKIISKLHDAFYKKAKKKMREFKNYDRSYDKYYTPHKQNPYYDTTDEEYDYLNQEESGLNIIIKNIDGKPHIVFVVGFEIIYFEEDLDDYYY